MKTQEELEKDLKKAQQEKQKAIAQMAFLDGIITTLQSVLDGKDIFTEK